jgi:hypothetical protein
MFAEIVAKLDVELNQTIHGNCHTYSDDDHDLKIKDLECYTTVIREEYEPIYVKRPGSVMPHNINPRLGWKRRRWS